jgi:hypothetical protein
VECVAPANKTNSRKGKRRKHVRPGRLHRVAQTQAAISAKWMPTDQSIDKRGQATCTHLQDQQQPNERKISESIELSPT